MDLEERYWAKVDVRGEDECWPWTAGTNGKYGKIYDGTRTPAGHPRTTGAHRVGFRIAFGPIPEGMLVCHTCDEPLCQNPRHWFLGDDQANCDDKISKGRARYPEPPRKSGEEHPGHVLTDAQVAEIRARYTGRRGEQTALAAEYGVTQPHVSLIVRNRTRVAT